MIIPCDINTISLPKNFSKDLSTVITLGNFDGVHLGHQNLLKITSQQACKQQAKSIVITFEPHPQKILKGSSPTPLTTQEKKYILLEKAGIDLIFQLQFSKQVASIDTETFTQQILLKKLRMKTLVLGHDFSMGNNRSGTKDTLIRLGEKFKFEVISLPPVYFNKKIISSSSIRKVLEDGIVTETTAMLGRLYSIDGTVINGKKRGGKIGFPTINLQQPPILVPLQGVYVTLVTLQNPNAEHSNKPLIHTNNTFLGVTDIGIQPTFEKKSSPAIETHIINFTGMLYNQNVSISFLERLRPEKTFKNVNELTTQIKDDIIQAKAILKNTGILLNKTKLSYL